MDAPKEGHGGMTRNNLTFALRRLCLGMALLLGIAANAAAQGKGLVIDGEEIASAQLFDAAKREGAVQMYSAYPADSIQAVADAFQQDSGIQVEIIRLVSERLFQRATAEFAAGKLMADYIDLTDLTLVRELVAKGVLNHPYKVPSFANIPDRIKDPDGRWYAFYRPVSVIGINTELVPDAEAPKTWHDLLDDKWQGRIGLQDIDVGGSAFTMYMYLRDVTAPDYWARLAAQQPRIYPGVAPAVTDMVRGEISAVAVGTPLLVSQIAQGAPVKIVFPSDGFPSFPVSGGIPTSAKHPNAAALLLNWLTSKRGGAVIGNGGSYPANSKAPAPQTQGIAFPSADRVWNIDIVQWEKLRTSYSNDWRKTFGQN